MNNSNYNCELIQDLLPLYQDNACSNTSRSIVDEHIADCDKCKAMLTRLQNTSVDDYLISEKNNVLEQHSKKEMKRTATIGIFTASILMIPVIVCLICNLAIGHGLDWFFIVLTSLLVIVNGLPQHDGIMFKLHIGPLSVSSKSSIPGSPWWRQCRPYRCQHPYFPSFPGSRFRFGCPRPPVPHPSPAPQIGAGWPEEVSCPVYPLPPGPHRPGRILQIFLPLY